MNLPTTLSPSLPAMNLGSSGAHGAHESGGSPALQTLARGSIAQRQVRDKGPGGRKDDGAFHKSLSLGRPPGGLSGTLSNSCIDYRRRGKEHWFVQPHP